MLHTVYLEDDEVLGSIAKPSWAAETAQSLTYHLDWARLSRSGGSNSYCIVEHHRSGPLRLIRALRLNYARPLTPLLAAHSLTLTRDHLLLRSVAVLLLLSVLQVPPSLLYVLNYIDTEHHILERHRRLRLLVTATANALLARSLAMKLVQTMQNKSNYLSMSGSLCSSPFKSSQYQYTSFDQTKQ